MPSILQSHFIDGNGSNPTTLAVTVRANSLLLIGVWHYNFGLVDVTDTFGLDWQNNGASDDIYRAGPTFDVLQIYSAFTGAHSGSTTISLETLSTASFFVVEVGGVPSTDAVDAVAHSSGHS